MTRIIIKLKPKITDSTADKTVSLPSISPSASPSVPPRSDSDTSSLSSSSPRSDIEVKEVKKKEAKIKNHSIAKDLLTLDLPIEIKRKADEICQSLHQKTHRNRKRKYLIFVCIYWAFKELGQEKDPRLLAKIINLETNKIQAAFSLFSAAKTGYIPAKKYTTAVELLPDYCQELGLDSQDIIELTRSLLSKSTKLAEKPPQTLAAGIIKYYIKINGVQINDKDIVRVCGRTITCIATSMADVAEVHNM